jgi:aspartate aminotransferase-like enzyme
MEFIMFCGSGTLGMEAAISNLAEEIRFYA